MIRRVVGDRPLQPGSLASLVRSMPSIHTLNPTAARTDSSEQMALAGMADYGSSSSEDEGGDERGESKMAAAVLMEGVVEVYTLWCPSINILRRHTEIHTR